MNKTGLYYTYPESQYSNGGILRSHTFFAPATRLKPNPATKAPNRLVVRMSPATTAKPHPDNNTHASSAVLCSLESRRCSRWVLVICLVSVFLSEASSSYTTFASSLLCAYFFFLYFFRLVRECNVFGL
ncbi:hypothetical protein QOT17_023902 [Balamuthia mandrillaris]